jgi:hypothetical protein
MITAAQLIAVAAEIMPGAEFKKFLLVNHQLPISDAMRDGDPDTAIVIHHPSDQCVGEVIELVDWIRCHPGPIVALLDAAATLQADGELTPISPLYGSIGCEIHRLSDDPAGPIVAIRGRA